MKHFFGIATSLFFLGFSAAHAQTNNQNSFVSPVDQDLTIKSVTLAPVSDNVGGIYARPLQKELISLLNADLQWSLSPLPDSIDVKAGLLEDDPKSVLKLMQASGADAVLAAHLTKGSRGVNGTLTLFAGHEGLPLLQQTLTDFKGFDIADVNAEFKRMYSELKDKMPFKGMILSRRGQDVTLNLGSTYGLRAGMNVTIVRIVQLHRHPKLHFMVGSEKEILGRVQLTKVDKNLSFGSVVLEREPGVISVGSKVVPEDFVKYSNPVVTPDGKILPELNARKDKDVAFGPSPHEWLPETPPQYGKISLLAGFSTYEQNSDLVSGASVSGKNGLAPNILIRGELWINPTWYVGFHLRQSVFSINNDLNGSSPSHLNMALGQYGVSGGYNFLLSDDFFGPKMQINAGFANSKFSVDNSSPTAFTTMEYSGFLLGFAGQFPVSDEIPLDLGANFNLWLNPQVSESSSSGSASNTVNSFGFFGDYRLRQRLKIKGEIDFEYYKSNFSGGGARANPASGTSHKLTTLLVGIEYLF